MTYLEQKTPLAKQIPTDATPLSAIKVRIRRNDKLVFNGNDYAFKRTVPGGYLMKCCDEPDREVAFIHIELMDARSKGIEVRIVSNFFSSQTGDGQERNFLQDLPRHIQEELLYRQNMITGILEAGVPLTDAALRPEIERLHTSYLLSRSEASAQGKNALSGEPFIALRCPSPSTVKRWNQRAREASNNPLALLPRNLKRPRRSSQLSVRQLQAIDAGINAFLTDTKRTMSTAYKHVEVFMDELNASARVQGFAEEKCPSIKSFRRACKRLDYFHTKANRLGVNKALGLDTPHNGGLVSNYPGEAIELDEVDLDLMVLMENQRLSEALGLDVDDLPKTNRLWVSVAIDRYSRCVLGLKIGISPTPEMAIATVKMVLQDKTEIAQRSGCRESWSARTTPDLIITDSGSAYISHAFKSSLSNLGCAHSLAPIKRPQMRAIVERFFRTLNNQLLDDLEGKTFSNPQERGDYNSEQRASLLLPELERLLVRYCVDIYNLAPHSGLSGATPKQTFEEGLKKYGITPELAPREIRGVFGTRMKRKLSDGGLRLFNLSYQSRELMEIYHQNGPCELELAVDQDDLGAITVIHGQNYIDVRCKGNVMDGISLSEWAERHHHNRMENKAFAQKFELTRKQATADLLRIGKDAALRKGLLTPPLAADKLHKLDETFFAPVNETLPGSQTDYLAEDTASHPAPVTSHEDQSNFAPVSFAPLDFHKG